MSPLWRRVQLQSGRVNGYDAPLRRLRELCGDRVANPLPSLQPPTQHLAGGFPGAGADRHIVGLTPQMKPQRGGGSKKIAKKVRELKKNS